MLSRHQIRVARLLEPLPESEDFAVAGGAALIAHGIVDRTTVDIDYFGRRREDVARLLPAAERQLQDAGYAVDRARDAADTGFVRLELTPEDGTPLGLDLSHDDRIRPVVDTRAQPAP